MGHQLHKYVTRHRSDVENSLAEFLPISSQKYTERFNDALHFAMFPGGKRWRPLLTLIAGSIVGACKESLLPSACAIEYLHTSSMIIDDLPAMDDADLRRGKPALHLAYDESTALLVSLALMNKSYSLFDLSCQRIGNPTVSGKILTEATLCIGEEGMIGGQVVDLEIGDGGYSPDYLDCRNLKTSALMRLMMTVGAIAQGASDAEIQVLANYGEALGMAYQIRDDLLDEIGDHHILGKTSKQDARHCRHNFVAEYGVEGAAKLAQRLTKEASADLRQQFGDSKPVELLSEAVAIILDMHQLSNIINYGMMVIR